MLFSCSRNLLRDIVWPIFNTSTRRNLFMFEAAGSSSRSRSRTPISSSSRSTLSPSASPTRVNRPTSVAAASDSTPPEHPQAIDPAFRSKFHRILEKWRKRELAVADQKYLGSVTLSADDYLDITDEYNVRHGVELQNNRIVLYECAADLHEYLGGYFDDKVMDTYGRANLIKKRSANKCHKEKSLI